MSKKAILFGKKAASFSAEVQQFFDRLMTPPTPARAILYASLIDGLVAAGIWSTLDVLMICAATDASTSLINLKSSSFQATIVGVPTFTADRGWACAGINNTVLSAYDASTAGGNYIQDSAMISCWSLSTTPGSHNFLWRPTGAVSNISCTIFGDFGGETDAQANCANTVFFTDTGLASGDPIGLVLTNRSSSSTCTVSRNNNFGTQQQTGALTSSAPQSGELAFGFAYQCAAYAIGGSLTTGRQTSLFNALTTYLTAVGAI